VVLGPSKRSEESCWSVLLFGLSAKHHKSYVAGLGAGMMEAILAVTPSETIKCVIHIMVISSQYWCVTTLRTKLIDDAKRPQPRYRGLIHGTVSIVRDEGLSGIYRGLFPVVTPFFSTWKRLSDLLADDAAGCEFCCSFHDLCNPQAICAGYHKAWSTITECDNVWNWWNSRTCDCIHNNAARVCFELRLFWNLHLALPLVLLRLACSLWKPGNIIVTLFIVPIGFSQRKEFCDSGRVQHLGSHDLWCVQSFFLNFDL